MDNFKDLFSKQAEIYRNSRPTYPKELYNFICGFCGHHELAWDCATGNGQCATALAEYFQKIIATDASASQIENAISHPKIEYKIATAYNSGLKNASVDLITVATAAHWFNIDEFNKEVDRVLKPGGILAVWSYAGCHVNPEIDKILNKLAFDILNDYWAPEIWRVWRDKYENLAFPYQLIPAPHFQTKLHWNLLQLINYLNSWSGVQNYKNINAENPVDIIENELIEAWGNINETKEITWHLYMKAGRKAEL